MVAESPERKKVLEDFPTMQAYTTTYPLLMSTTDATGYWDMGQGQVYIPLSSLNEV